MNITTIPDVLGLADHSEHLTWEPFRTGIMLSRVHGDPAAAPAAALLRYEPGASVPAHEHVGWEYIFVLSGSQQDDHGSYGRGSLRINPPGSRHGVTSVEGCLVLAIWERSVKFLPAPAPTVAGV